MSNKNENTSQISDDNLVDKILNKIEQFDSENKIKISKANLNILIQNEKIKNMLEYFCDNVKNNEEISRIREKIKNFQLNQEKIKNISQLKEKKEKLKNELKMKKNHLLKIKEKKEETLKNKNLLIDTENECKKEEEEILTKSKILKNSIIKFKKISEEFSNFRFLENYKLIKNFKIEKDTIESEENFSFEKFLDENQKFFLQNFTKENNKKIPNVNKILKSIVPSRRIEENLRFI
jgi:hypothetical protein